MSLYEKLIKPRALAKLSRRNLFAFAVAMLLLSLGGVALSGFNLTTAGGYSPVTGFFIFVSGIFLLPASVIAFWCSLIGFSLWKRTSGEPLAVKDYSDDEAVEYEVLPVKGIADGAPYVERFFKVADGKLWVTVSDDGEAKVLPVAPVFSKGSLDRVDSVRTVYDAIEGSAPRLKVIFGEWESARRYLHYEIHVPMSEKKPVKGLIRSVYEKSRAERYAAAVENFGDNEVSRLIDEPILRINHDKMMGGLEFPGWWLLHRPFSSLAMTASAALLAIALVALYSLFFFTQSAPVWLMYASGALALAMIFFNPSIPTDEEYTPYDKVWDYSSLEFAVLPFNGLDSEGAVLDDYIKSHEGKKYVLLEEDDYKLMGTYKLPVNASVKYTLDDSESPLCLIEGNEGEEDEDEGIDGKITDFCLYFPERFKPSTAPEVD